MDISKFANKVNEMGGAAPVNRFLVNIIPPKKMVNKDSQEKLAMLCETQSLPGAAIGTFDRSTPYGYGPNYKLPWGVIFSDIDLGFIGDSRGFVHNFFMTWLNQVVEFNVDSITKVGASSVPFFVNYQEDYATQITIHALDVLGNKLITYTLHNAYPIIVSDVQGSWQANNQYMKIQVKMNYTRWTVKYDHLSDVEINTLSSIDLNRNIHQMNQQEVDNLNNKVGNIVAQAAKQKYNEYASTYKNVIPLLSNLDYNPIY